MTLAQDRPLHLSVIGGGLTGAALCIHAARAATGPLVLDVIEPAAAIGRGIAYGTQDPAHRINVPSDRMSLFPDQGDHLTRWLFDHGVLPDPASTDPEGHHYVPRGAYGDYVTDCLKHAVEARGGLVRLRHHRARATGLRAAGGGWAIDLSDGRRIAADKVALCCGHAVPGVPASVSEAALRHPGFVANAWSRDAFAAIGPGDSVLVVGTGLTMADVVASLDRMGHAGPVTAISRRGLLARPQGLFLSGIDLLEGRASPTTARGLLRLVRRRVRDLGPSIGWQPVVDAVRFGLARLWPALPPAEQRKVARWLLPFWEVHRFRVAPQVHGLLDAARHGGRLSVACAAFEGLATQDDRLVAILRPRGGVRERRSFDHVVLCTGPGRRLAADPLMAAVLADGLARPDAVGLGLAVDPQGRLLRPDGSACPDLSALGPIVRGSFGEMTGAPDIIRHVALVAPLILAAAGAVRANDRLQAQARSHAHA